MNNKAIGFFILLSIVLLIFYNIIGGLGGNAEISAKAVSLASEYNSVETDEDEAFWRQIIGMGFSMIGGFETEYNINMKEFLLTAFLPWDYNGKENDDFDLVFNYAAGDESAYFRNNDNVEEPVVAIYSTHSAESYIPYCGKESESGSHGGVYVASGVVAETLTDKGMPTLVSDTIHDYPDWSKSYGNSLVTATALLADNPSVKIIIDMHRDGGVPKSMTTAEINGKSAARIMLVVGSNQRYEHPNWRQNLAFAQTIGNKTEEMYPGLLRAVKVQNGRYNQHISTHSILVEMGATENTIEEVEYSSVLLANVLEAVLKDMQ